MTDVTSVSTSTAATTQAKNTTESKSETNSKAPASSIISADFETFLTMLTVQMQNQDPLNPMDSTEYASQLATFSAVEQQVKTNDLLSEISGQFTTMGMGQLAGWIGLEGRAEMPAYYTGDAMRVHTTPAAAADEAVLVVKDEYGRIMQQVPADPEGGTFLWTGEFSDGSSVPPGLYEMELLSYNNGELISTDPVEVYGTIQEARQQGSEVILVMAGGEEVVSSAVTGLRQPDDS